MLFAVLYPFNAIIIVCIIAVKELHGWESIIASKNEVLAISWEKEYSKTCTGESEIFICVKIYNLVSKVPDPLNHRWELFNWGFSKVRSEASTQRFHSSVELSPMKHQAS